MPAPRVMPAIRFRFFGVPVVVNLWFFAITILLNANALSSPPKLIVWIAVVFGGVLMHEMGHAVAIRMAGRSPEIELRGTGGMTRWRESELGPMRPVVQLGVSLAGPFTGLSIAAIMAGILQLTHSWPELSPDHGASTPLAKAFVEDMLFVNAGWSALNLLPIIPLDGGNALASLIDIFAHNRGRVVALAVSVLVGAAAALAAFNFGMPWAGMIVAMMTIDSVRALPFEWKNGVDRDLFPLLIRARATVARGELDAADLAAHELLSRAKTSAVLSEARHVVAWVAFRRGDVETAARELDLLDPNEPRDSLLEGLIMLRRGDREHGLARLENVFAAAPNPQVGAEIIAAYRDAHDIAGLRKFISEADLRTLPPQSVEPLIDEAHADGDHATAAELAMSLFNAHRRPMDAVRAASSLSLVGRAEEGLQWLARARDAGFADRALLDSADELELVRKEPGWFGLRATIPAKG